MDEFESLAAQANARIAKLIESGEAGEDGLLKFPDPSLSYMAHGDEQLWRWDGEEWVLVESQKEGEADGRDTGEAPEDQP